jgi:hypothetical protein
LTFGIIVITYVRMCENIVPEHTCDEYSILGLKIGYDIQHDFSGGGALCLSGVDGKKEKGKQGIAPGGGFYSRWGHMLLTAGGTVAAASGHSVRQIGRLDSTA